MLAVCDECAEALMDGANAFKRGTRKLHNRLWWQNMKCNLILLGIAVGILLSELHVGGWSKSGCGL